MTSYRREVAEAEKGFIAYNEMCPPFVIQLVVEGDGAPEPEALHDALIASAKANPGVAVKIEGSDEHLHWVPGPEPTLTVLDAPEFTAMSEENAPFLLWPIDAMKGPNSELLSVKGKEKHYLIFRASHAVMDGQGTLLWVKDFMRCLRGEAPIGHPDTDSVERWVSEQKKKRRKLPLPTALHPFGKPQGDRHHTFHWRRVVVDRPLDMGATGRLVVALAERAREHGPGDVRIALPTDLRPYLKELKTTGNAFSILFLDVPEGASADMIAMRVVRMLYKDEGLDRFGHFTIFEKSSLHKHRIRIFWDLANEHTSGTYAFSAVLSHLGALEKEDFCGPDFEASSAFFVPPIGDSGCILSVNGFGDHTEISGGLSNLFAGGDNMETLARLMESSIRGS